LIHRNAANAATENMTQDAHLKIVPQTRNSKHQKQHAIGYEYIHIAVNSHQLTTPQTAGICRELRVHGTPAQNGKPPWSTKAVVHTLCEI